LDRSIEQSELGAVDFERVATTVLPMKIGPERCFARRNEQ
jgi:hypothetical protein